MPRMDYWALIAIVAVANPSRATTFAVSWNLSLDAEGHITKISTPDTRNPGVHADLEQLIRGWQFKSGRVDGVPAAADTTLTVVMESTPATETIATIRVVSAWTGAGAGKLVAPRYPVEGAKRFQQGKVLLRVRFDGDGKVIDAAPEPGTPQADDMFVQSSLTAVRRWRFVPEVVGGRAMAGTTLVPMCYSISSARVPLDCNWHPPGNSAAVPTGELFTLDPFVRLLTDVGRHEP